MCEETSAKRKILLVEDNEINREIMKEFLKTEYEILEAEDGEEGLALLEKEYQSLSLIFLDLVMPRCDGYEFLERVKDDTRLNSVPVVIMTADATAEVEERCLHLGAVEFLQKSSNPVLVRARARNIIRMCETARSLGKVEIDELTGIYTRQAFFLHAKEILDKNPKASFDIVIAEIQNFRTINSIYGEAIGDEILLHMASFGRQNIFNGICARYGGDQFVALIPSGVVDYEKWLLEKLQKYLETAPVTNLVIKNGVYANVDRSLTIPAMCDRAALALNTIKHTFSRRTAYFDSSVSRNLMRARRYEEEFEKSVKNHEFVPWYQPKYDPFTGKLVGGEALVRWKKEDGTFCSPADFLDVFENNGQIVKLDEYMFNEVCRQQKTWQEQGKKIVPISVNLSRKSMYRRDISERYKIIMKDLKLPIGCVPIEITENAAVDCAEVKPLADAFYEAGFSLHMDDFGSGQSSLNGLNLLRFEVVKIDKSLTDSIGDSRGEIILEYTVALAKKLGLDIVVEGVENEMQLKFLKGTGCDAIQGYYYSKPLPSEEFEKLLENCDGDKRKK